MNITALFSALVFAAEAIISPLPDTKPPTHFADLIYTSNVLGISTSQASPSSSFKNVMNTSDTEASEAAERRLKKNIVSFALLGDSMMDTLGPDFHELADALVDYYPSLTPAILNYGVGSTNIENGIERITHDYNYQGIQIKSLQSLKPDVVVLESFAYNPFPYETGALNRHWLDLGKAVSLLRKTIPNVQVVIAATIAPNAEKFADGAPGINFSAKDKEEHVKVIKGYLESTTRFAKGENLPLADAYHLSLLPDGNGNPNYINPEDHIHPSEEGRKFFANAVAKAIIDSRLLEDTSTPSAKPLGL